MEEQKPTHLLELEEIKLEAVEDEEVKQEVLDDEYFEKNAPKLEETWEASAIPSEVYQEYNAPKLEEPWEESAIPSEVYQEDNSPKIEEPWESDGDFYVENYSDASSAPPAKRMSYYKHTVRCKFCKEMQNRTNVKHVSLREEKDLLVLGFYLLGLLTDQDVQYLHKVQQPIICHSHFEEAFEEICDALHIENLSEIDSCSPESKIMETINYLFPYLDFETFVRILKKFAVRNKHLMGKVAPQKKEKPEKEKASLVKAPRQETRMSCTVCWKISNVKDLEYVTEDSAKELIIIAFTMKGGSIVTPSFTSGQGIYICRSHVEQTPVEIFRALHIGKLSEIDSCPAESIEAFMKIARGLFPSLTFRNVVLNLHKFAGREEKVPGPVIKPIDFEMCEVCGMRVEIKNLKYISLKEEKQLIMIGHFLQGNTIKDPDFMETPRRRLVCISHFQETLNEIYTALRITNRSELVTCSPATIQGFMQIVQSIFKLLQFGQFINSVHRFAERNKHLICEVKIPREESPERKETLLLCSMCSKHRFSDQVKLIPSKFETMTLLVGYIILQKIEINQAKTILFGNEDVYICRDHYNETYNVILNHLNLKKPEEILASKPSIVQDLMPTVNAFFPHITPEYFLNILNRFINTGKQNL